MNNKKIQIAIIGAGPAGLVAAAQSAAAGATVTVFEKNDFTGKKLLITGKGRCNLTNNCTLNEFLENVPVNPKFLYNSLNTFSPSDVMNLFENELNVPLKTERGKRVFPVSDRSLDIQKALEKYSIQSGSQIKKLNISSIEKNANGFFVYSGTKKFDFDRVIIATGGKSYPRTGSTGDGYRFARELGHEVTELSPSLVPIVTQEKFVSDMMGLALKNVRLKVYDNIKNKCIYDDFGEMLFTHFGVSGPLILSASCHIRDIKPGRYKILIDLKSALDEQALDKRVLSDFCKQKNKAFKNSLAELLPSAMIPVFVSLSEIDANKQVNEITKEERKKIISLFKQFPLTVKSFRPIEEAIITSGGVKVGNINPKTMESKICPGLFFAGEVIDVDAYTGGFNLQIAFSTGYVAGKSAAESNNNQENE